MSDIIWGAIGGLLIVVVFFVSVLATDPQSDLRYCEAYGAAINNYHGKDYCYVAND
jgi:hypothetical protein